MKGQCGARFSMSRTIACSVSAILLLLALLSFPKGPRVQAGTASQLDVVISEIAWMGTTTDVNDEWIELYNTTNQTIDLTNWTLQAEDGSPNVTLSGNIPPKGYFLLERIDDTSAPACDADQIYTGALENGGENLFLKDTGSNVIDQVDAWYAGNNTTKQTMLRTNTTILGTNAAAWSDGSINGDAQCVATLVVLLSFTATAHDGFILVEWETASEIDTEGFNLWRAGTAHGLYEKLNKALIPARGGPTRAASYTYDDATLTDDVTYYYKLEDVDTHGVSTFHGPVVAVAGRTYRLYLPLLQSTAVNRRCWTVKPAPALQAGAAGASV